MPPKRTTTPMTDAAIKALIAQSVVDALAEHEANKSNENGNESRNSGSGGRRTERTTLEIPVKFALYLAGRCTKHGRILTLYCWSYAAYGMPWKTT
ncbi:hypothetical protein Tco_1161219 [Tanacetum coccineum]